VQDKRILLVDDVVTTGHTLRSCAVELRRQGAASVSALVFARSNQQATQPPNRASAT
jgi:predicted amidophosphoribosyltransferase